VKAAKPLSGFLFDPSLYKIALTDIIRTGIMDNEKEKRKLHPDVNIGLLADLDRKDKDRVIKKLGEVRFENWDETLSREYHKFYRIKRGDKKSQYARSEEDIRRRLEAYSDGQIVVVYEGEITDALRKCCNMEFVPHPIGEIGGFIRNRIFGYYNEEITGFGTYSTHESDGIIFICGEIVVDERIPDELLIKGLPIKRGVAKGLINEARGVAEASKIPIAAAKSRPHRLLDYMNKIEGKSLHEIKRIALDRESLINYLFDHLQPSYTEDGRLRVKNKVLGMHLSNGAEIEPWCIEPLTRPDDIRSLGSNVVAVYKGKDKLKQLYL
jgi:hypothetical protein